MPGSPHRIPAGLVLPVVMATADNQRGFGPDNLAADLEIARLKAGGNSSRVQGTVPDISDVAREQCPCLAPV